MTKTKAQPLSERVAEIRAEIDEFIDAKVEEMRVTCSGVPPAVLRITLTSQEGDCLCRSYLNMTKDEDGR